ncbi:MAG: uracil-DNA glycosylase [Elusimicrobia bacterium]|nr:uracil-DNA glycosylase [Elusimicrobiota bacterium]
MSDAQELLELARSLRARIEDGDIRLAPASPVSLSPKPPTPPSEPVSLSPKGERGGVRESVVASTTLESLKEQVSACKKCPLGGQRLNAVFGVGSAQAEVMFVGEGPGYQEDRQGEPFVGRAGQLLDDILRAIGLSRETVYIANVVKCHPMKDPGDPDARGNDRPPTPKEMEACMPYLQEQIRLIAPRVIVTLGNVATKALLREETGISRLRGQWRELAVPGMAAPLRLLPTYHPAALLRDPGLKRDVWTDMKNLRTELTKT